MHESAIEALLVRSVHQAGGRCYKWVSPGNSGVPDRIVILPDSRVIFVELKTETGRTSALQDWQIGTLRGLGQAVRVLHGRHEVELFIQREVMRCNTSPTTIRKSQRP